MAPLATWSNAPTASTVRTVTRGLASLAARSRRLTASVPTRVLKHAQTTGAPGTLFGTGARSAAPGHGRGDVATLAIRQAAVFLVVKKKCVSAHCWYPKARPHEHVPYPWSGARLDGGSDTVGERGLSRSGIKRVLRV